MQTITALIATSGLDKVDSRVLMQHVLGVSRAWLIAHGDEFLSEEQLVQFQSLVARRQSGEPIAYLVGYREFWGRDFRVTSDVLIPRPETELLIEEALARLPKEKPLNIIDIGTGSGCIAITLKLESPNWSVYGLDISAAALAVAKQNAMQLKADVTWLENDLLNNLIRFGYLPKFDAIISNPPYIPQGDPHLSQGDLRFEPSSALTDFSDGLECYKHIANHGKDWLNPDGLILVEHGYDQGESVPKVFQNEDWIAHDISDYAGNPRICVATLKQ